LLVAQPVRCDICGKLFNSRHLGAHKRLSHPKAVSSDPAAVQKIVKLFDGLSADGKKKVLAALGLVEEKTK
jgi:hypothetical protein